MTRWKDNPQLVSLAGDERIPATSTSGGAKVGGGSVAAGKDVFVTPEQLKDYAGGIAIVSNITSGTITPTGDTDLVRPAALTAALTVANPSSTPSDGWGIVIELIDDGTALALTWGSKYANRMSPLPTTTIAGKRLRVGVEYHAGDDKLYCMHVQVQP